MYGRNIAEAPPHNEGGLLQSRSHEHIESHECILNVTSNYSFIFKEHFNSEGIYWLYGKPAKETVPKLKNIINALGNFSPDVDYWKPTAGNARKALEVLLKWAEIHPKAVWNII
jgi:hypothetical protein